MPQKNITTSQYHFFLTDEFSQWYPSYFIDEAGTSFICCEQFMMYKKAELFHDHDMMEKILLSHDPDDMKQLGRAVKNFDPVVWDNHAADIVTEGNFLKFSQNPELAHILLSFKNHILVEAAGYDKIWGIGLYAEDAVKVTEKEWLGRNELGKALMRVQQRLIDFPHLIQSQSIDQQKLFSFEDKKGQKIIRLNVHELATFLKIELPQLKHFLENSNDVLSLSYLPFVKKEMTANTIDLLTTLNQIEITYPLKSISQHKM